MIARLISLALAGIAAQAVVAAPAGAAFEQRVAADRLAAGPLLAGDAVVHAERRGDGIRLVRTPLAGGAAATLADLTPRPSTDLVLAGLAASADGFAYGVVEQGPADTGALVAAARFGATPHGIDGCSGGRAAVALSGATVVHDSCGLRVAALDEEGPGTPLAGGEAGRLPQAAEPYAAYVAGDSRPDVVVVDLRSRQDVYRMPGDALPGSLRGCTLSSNGTVVALYAVTRRVSGRRRAVTRAAWASPAARSWHRLPLPDARFLTARAAGDRVGFLLRPFGASPARVGVVPLTAGATRTLASGRFGRTIDFDGKRIAYSVARRGVRLLRVRDV
ncbi:MAG TPA: hypothetical protein VF549_20860 [Solirubrobacteraceae bacterium]|jgi:hypothetical protein